MKKLLIMMAMAFLTILPLAQSAHAAGGAGPDKDMLKGLITQVDETSRTFTFVRESDQKTFTFTMAEKMTVNELPINAKVMINLDKKAGEGVVKDVSRMFLDMNLKTLISLMVIGLVGGLLSGFIGSGGAFVLTPAMMSLGVPGAVAVASNMCHKFPKAMVGAYKRYKYGQADLKLGLVMASTAIIGVQIGVQIQKYILHMWGNAGSNLYVSVVFVLTLVLVGSYVFMDAKKLASKKGDSNDHEVGKLALAMQKINLPPMMHFKTANVRISAWITVPVGLFTGILAATIAVGGFIGVPGMMYVIGASAVVASATELVIAFVMGFWGSVQWGLSGLIDIRLTLLILSTSLIGVQLGALGTTYVKDYVIKIVMASVMLIVAVSRGAKVPGYLADLDLIGALTPQTAALLEAVSFWALVGALGTAGIIITAAMAKGIMGHRAEQRRLAQGA
ncbi:MAG: sulfite exporter TauE/SafE family protein [Thermodesulfobacteriota bacterium]